MSSAFTDVLRSVEATDGMDPAARVCMHRDVGPS